MKMRNILLAMTMIIATLLTGCAKKQDASERVLNIVSPAEIKGFDPIMADDLYSGREIGKIYEGLLAYHWLKVPFKIIDHLCGIRPATLERRPFVGFHPLHPSIGILNGMGTKGCSLAPFFAKQLANHLVHNEPINSEADVYRFSKILSRNIS